MRANKNNTPWCLRTDMFTNVPTVSLHQVSEIGFLKSKLAPTISPYSRMQDLVDQFKLSVGIGLQIRILRKVGQIPSIAFRVSLILNAGSQPVSSLIRWALPIIDCISFFLTRNSFMLTVIGFPESKINLSTISETVMPFPLAIL